MISQFTQNEKFWFDENKLTNSILLPQENSVALLESSILWADGFLLLYSITQRLSFLEIPRLKRLIDQTKKSLGKTIIWEPKDDLSKSPLVLSVIACSRSLKSWSYRVYFLKEI